MNKTTVYNDITLLHPKMRGPVKRLADYLIDSYETGRTKTRFEIFETFRSPLRQAYLAEKGASKAGPFESAHQFGLACDFVAYLSQAEASAFGAKAGWSWDDAHDWDYLKKAADLHGLGVPILWDRVHVEHPYFRTMKKCW